MRSCPFCEYTSTRQYNLARHIHSRHKTTEPEEDGNTNPETTGFETIVVAGGNGPCGWEDSSTMSSMWEEDHDGTHFPCLTCYRSFSSEQGLQRHVPNCKKEQHRLQCYKCLKMYKDKSSKSRHIRVCNGSAHLQDHPIEVPNASPPSTIINHQTINNIQTQNNNPIIHNYNITIQPFGKERLDHITSEFKDMCIRAINGAGVRMMVQQTHFNPDVPENHNVRIKSTKHQQVSVFNGDRWAIKDKTEIVDKMVMNTCASLIKHYHQSPIRDEDMNDHHNVLIQNLMSIGQKMPSLYHPVKRQLFAMICDLSQKLIEDG